MPKGKVKLGKCSFKMPTAERVFGEREVWRVDCACGTTCLGNTKEDAETCWKHHYNSRTENKYI